LASAAGGATIIGFNTRLENGVQGQAKHHGINIFTHNIIYELIDIVKDAMADLLDPELREKKLGSAEVRQLFSIGRGRNVAGCMVTEGVIRRDANARLLRNGETILDGKMDTLRRFKDDVAEVRAGYECGIHLVDFETYEEGDIIECFEIEKIRPSL
jgi:translation initiation factor IF-2